MKVEKKTKSTFQTRKKGGKVDKNLLKFFFVFFSVQVTKMIQTLMFFCGPISFFAQIFHFEFFFDV